MWQLTTPEWKTARNLLGSAVAVEEPVALEEPPVSKDHGKTALKEMHLMVNRKLTINTGPREEVVVQRHDGMNFAFPFDETQDPAMRDDVLSRINTEQKPIVPDKPSTDTLRAMQTPELKEGDTRQALAVQVEDLLGYTPLRKDAGAPSRLQRLLRELDITPFDPATVEEYKHRMRAHFLAKIDADPEVKFFDMRTGGLVSGANAARHMRAERYVEWRMELLNDYRKPVPEFVLRKCVQIKQAAPEAKFLVNELREERRTLDPFLVVRLGEDVAWIEVWDEPEFEKSL